MTAVTINPNVTKNQSMPTRSIHGCWAKTKMVEMALRMNTTATKASAMIWKRYQRKP